MSGSGFVLREGAGGKQFPFGRWNRDQGHRGEILYQGNGCWATCSCGFMGEVHAETEAADAEMIAHERMVFERTQKQGKRFVRGRWEPT